jgi:predicted phosphodiesterase
MRLAILSDIHGNSEALKQVLADIDRCELNEIFCLGDNIGYGPEPDEVISLIRQRNIPGILGNHELAVLEPEQLESFNPNARASLIKTMPLLSREAYRYIGELVPSMVAWDCRFVHGYPPDSALTYLTFVTENTLRRTFEKMKEKICFLEHTHELEIVRYNGHAIRRSPLGEARLTLSRKNQYMVNIGSVGQPRDGNSTAKYAILDTDAYSLEIRFVPYDIKKVADKIRQIGFPEVHARRLWQG